MSTELVVEKYTTGSRSEFRRWIPEIGERLFTNFDVDSVFVYVKDGYDNVVCFAYDANAKPLSPEYSGRVAEIHANKGG